MGEICLTVLLSCQNSKIVIVFVYLILKLKKSCCDSMDNFVWPRTNILSHLKNLNCRIKIYRLKVQSCKLDNDMCMIASTQITNTGIFAFKAVLVFKLLSRNILFINRKDSRIC